ncbi:MAG: hypothetical protein KGI29_04635 [Pseudomonadota bacterium]|nr:hypothetical protein [Pseudomonadota bacterium]MDE3037083.1 hypothetical protein [Pseudomonadota bacterium]
MDMAEEMAEEVVEWFNRNVRPDWTKDRITLEFEKAHLEGKIKAVRGKEAAMEELKALRQHTWNGKIRAIPGKTIRGLGWGAAIVAGLGGLAFLTSRSKKAREFDPRNEPLPEGVVNDIPQVLTTDALAMPDPESKQSKAQREVLGPHTAKVLGRDTNGLDTMPPNLQGSDGASLIDGKPLQSLGAPSLS